MNNPLISVIVPIYKVERYLRECIDSILVQTYSNLEIILIDDGSPDDCPIICDEYAKKDCRIKVIHQKNGGLAHARNVGIANTKGQYLTFIDSDDYVSNNYVELLYRGLVESNADISIASFYVFKGNEICQQFSGPVIYEMVEKEDAISRYCSINADRSMSFISACNKLYRKKLFDGIEFPKDKLYEDAFTTYKLVDRAEKIVFTTSKFYFYRVNPQSILGQAFKEKHLEMIEAFRSGLDYFRINNKETFSKLFIPPLLMREIYCWWGMRYVLGKKKEADHILKDYGVNCRDLKCGKIDLFWYVAFKIIACCPWTYVLYRKLSPCHVGDRL